MIAKQKLEINRLESTISDLKNQMSETAQRLEKTNDKVVVLERDLEDSRIKHKKEIESMALVDSLPTSKIIDIVVCHLSYVFSLTRNWIIQLNQNCLCLMR